jgi:small conductance mechanosensitive channel
MVRNVVVMVLVAIGVVNVLAELGVNTNALLAGAGVVGLALGFGSQKLVQDLINGLFVLLGDTVRVGDVVDLTGKAGVVEAISMRTITLRDYNGNVHTIPYSSIDVVTNMTKDFAFAVVDVAVDYKEDADEVMEVLREIDTQLRREWPYRRLILEPLEIVGVGQFRETSMLIKARIKVRAGEQWKVCNEFNRRMKRRFDELGIEISSRHRMMLFGTDPQAAAPPASIQEAREALLGEQQAPRRLVGES